MRLTIIPASLQLDEVWKEYQTLLQAPQEECEGDFCPIISREDKVIIGLNNFGSDLYVYLFFQRA